MGKAQGGKLPVFISGRGSGRQELTVFCIMIHVLQVILESGGKVARHLALEAGEGPPLAVEYERVVSPGVIPGIVAAGLNVQDAARCRTARAGSKNLQTGKHSPAVLRVEAAGAFPETVVGIRSQFKSACGA